MGEEMEGKKVGEFAIDVKLKGMDDLQVALDEAAEHIAAARKILNSLAGGVTIGVDVIASDTTSRSGDSSSGDRE